jgi:hypothetical protein
VSAVQNRRVARAARSAVFAFGGFAFSAGFQLPDQHSDVLVLECVQPEVERGDDRVNDDQPHVVVADHPLEVGEVLGEHDYAALVQLDLHLDHAARVAACSE